MSKQKHYHRSRRSRKKQSPSRRIARFIWRFFKIYVFMVGLSTLLLVASLFFILSDFDPQEFFDSSFMLGSTSDKDMVQDTAPTDDVMVVVDLDGIIYETFPSKSHSGSGSALDMLLRQNSSEQKRSSISSIRSLLTSLRKRQNIRAVLFNVSPFFEISSHFAEELMPYFKALSKAKPTYFYAPTFSHKTLLLASYAERVAVAEGGSVHLNIPSLLIPYVGKLFLEFGIKFEIISSGDWKTATLHLQDQASAKQKRMLRDFQEVRNSYEIDLMHAHRKQFSDRELRSLYEETYLSAQEATELGLITDVLHLMDFKDQLAAHTPLVWKNYNDYYWPKQTSSDRCSKSKASTQAAQNGPDGAKSPAEDHDGPADDDSQTEQEQQEQKEAATSITQSATQTQKVAQNGCPDKAPSSEKSSEAEAERHLFKPSSWFADSSSQNSDEDEDKEEPALGFLNYSGNIQFTEGDHPAITPERVQEDVEWILEQKEVKAVVIRVQSPGGSALASELIYHQIRRLSLLKPVVIYIDRVAGSGGYYLAVAGRKIVSRPLAVLGSIGVMGLRANIEKMAQKYGITMDVYSISKYELPITRAMNPETLAKITKSMNEVYQLFVQRVADGRRTSPDHVHQNLGQGRIWLGQQAIDNGLIDRIGGLKSAYREAKLLANLDPNKKYPIITTPIFEELSLLECLANPARCLGASHTMSITAPPSLWLYRLLGASLTGPSLATQKQKFHSLLHRLSHGVSIQMRMWVPPELLTSRPHPP